MTDRLVLLLFLFVFCTNAPRAQTLEELFGAEKDEWTVYKSPQGWEMAIPREARPEVADGYARWNEWVEGVWLRWSVGLSEREEVLHYQLLLREDRSDRYLALPAALNPALANRKGLRPSIRESRDRSHTIVTVIVDYDPLNLLSVTFNYPTEDAGKAETVWKKMLASFKTGPQAQYQVSPLARTFFDPPRRTNEALGALEGPLKGKVDHFLWEMPGQPDWDSIYEYDPIVAALPDNGFVCAWRDSTHTTYLQMFSADMKPRGRSIPLPGLIVHALTGDHKGFAGLVSKFQGDYLQYNGHTWLVGFDLEGRQRFKTEVVGTDDIGKTDERLLFRRRKNQSLAFSGTHYGVYVSIEKNFGPSKGTHEGDLICYFDENGKLVRNESGGLRGDEWGVSHSFTKAVCWDGELFCYLTVGDGYPRGLAYRRYGVRSHEEEMEAEVNIWPIPGSNGDNNVYSTEVNGLVANKELVLGVFTSFLNTRPVPGTEYYHPDLYLAVTGKNGSRHAVRPLQASPGLAEYNPRITRYRDLFLVIWHEFDQTQKHPGDTYTVRYLLLNAKGEKVGRPEKLPTWFAQESPKSYRMRFINHSGWGGSGLVPLKNGNLVWLRYLPDGKGAEIVRIRQ